MRGSVRVLATSAPPTPESRRGRDVAGTRSAGRAGEGDTAHPVSSATRSLIAVGALIVLFGVPIAIWSATSESDKPDTKRGDLVLERFIDPRARTPSPAAR